MLSKKNIVIIGGAGLLGREFISAIKESGANVIVFDCCSSEIWKSTNIDVSLFLETDMTDKINLSEAIQRTHHKFGRIDALVNTAYPRNKNYGRRFFEVEIDDFNQNVAVHLGGYFLAAQMFARYFKKQGHGNIINLASVQGVIAPKFDTYENTDMTAPVEYAVIKSGIIHLTRYMAKYLKRCNIRVNCISPGGILDNQPEIFLSAYNQKCVNKGMLDRKDINGALIFLLSDQSKFINGQNLIVDDGFTL